MSWPFSSSQLVHMGESFQDYSWIHDFEADFSQNAELDFNSFSDSFQFIFGQLTI